ncbi:hypothetical protein ASG43_17955 [Aureimonas sp. Leaf454]|uniref:FAD-dependent monooxygenase n=1 Tax=Aureimonas sp. Leaf454 TaxID=1736381 RepID=UPI0006FD1997|nr:FAD-dependent monooxygenase [Aureimonas sp. Leaf454]KQT53717.1 hypothetical protein ASG43_17955 [Aureimonas sp. Leaf454]
MRDSISESSRRATVVGAGIAGLTMALCLARDGWFVEILERSAILGEAGAGLQLSPNALRVLSGLGLLDRLRMVGVSARSVTLRSGRTGRRLATVPVSSADGTPYLSLLRTDLQTVLLEAVMAESRISLRLDQGLIGLEGRSGGGFDLAFADAAGRRTSVFAPAPVIAADGVHSAVAAALGLPASKPSGLVAWRMMLDEPLETPGIEAWLGRDLHAVAYPVDAGRRTNLVAIAPQTAGSQAEAEREPAQAFDRRFAGWNTALLQRIQRAGSPGRWPLLDADRMGERLPSGLFLIGDSAHAMLPFAAQGAAMAIEDAAVLAHGLRETHTFEEADRQFQMERAPRLKRVRKRVDFHRFVYHLAPPLSWGRNAALAARSPASLQRDLAWLYDWAPPTA